MARTDNLFNDHFQNFKTYGKRTPDAFLNYRLTNLNRIVIFVFELKPQEEMKLAEINIK